MNVIHEIVAECEKEIAFMYQVHDFVYGDERHNMINRLLRLNHRPDEDRSRLNRGCLDKVDLEWVKQNIWAEYWRKVTDMTNVLLIMPASRRDEWREQFIEGKQETIKTDRTGYQMKVKEFGPLIVSIDAHGNNLIDNNKVIFNERKAPIVEEISAKLDFLD